VLTITVVTSCSLRSCACASIETTDDAIQHTPPQPVVSYLTLLDSYVVCGFTILCLVTLAAFIIGAHVSMCPEHTSACTCSCAPMHPSQARLSPGEAEQWNMLTGAVLLGMWLAVNAWLLMKALINHMRHKEIKLKAV
jgi:hypothetical protein